MVFHSFYLYFHPWEIVRLLVSNVNDTAWYKTTVLWKWRTWTCRKIQFKSSILCTISDCVPIDTVSFNTTEFNTLIVLKYLFVWISSYLERKGYYGSVTYYGFKLRIKYLDIMMSVFTESIIDFSRTFLNIIFKKRIYIILKNIV